jgi:sporulation protein YlmC with PRC-barrel domain
MTMMISGLLLEAAPPTFAAGPDAPDAGETVEIEQETDAQVALGGAQYVIEGSITTIEDRYYFMRKKDTGEQIRLIVNRDTNLDCAGMPDSRSGKAAKADTMTSERTTPKEQAPEASQQQLRQGQREDETARGSGFQVGPCSFRVGDQVKAEVDDNGKVTTLKYLAGKSPVAARSMGSSAATGLQAIPGEQDKPAVMDLTGGQGYPPKDYAVVPLRRGKLKSDEGNALIQKPVMNQQGEQVGTLDNLLVDTATGKIEYAVILVAHTDHHLHPIPWMAVKIKRDARGSERMVVDTNQYKIHSDVSMKDVVDHSPAVETLMKNMETLRADERKRATKRPIERSTGPTGEGETGGAGPSAERSEPPPGPAPGFENEKSKRD